MDQDQLKAQRMPFDYVLHIPTAKCADEAGQETCRSLVVHVGALRKADFCCIWGMWRSSDTGPGPSLQLCHGCKCAIDSSDNWQEAMEGGECSDPRTTNRELIATPKSIKLTSSSSRKRSQLATSQIVTEQISSIFPARSPYANDAMASRQ